jgi:hypothetical protein
MAVSVNGNVNARNPWTTVGDDADDGHASEQRVYLGGQLVGRTELILTGEFGLYVQPLRIGLPEGDRAT